MTSPVTNVTIEPDGSTISFKYENGIKAGSSFLHGDYLSEYMPDKDGTWENHYPELRLCVSYAYLCLFKKHEQFRKLPFANTVVETMKEEITAYKHQGIDLPKSFQRSIRQQVKNIISVEQPVLKAQPNLSVIHNRIAAA